MTLGLAATLVADLAVIVGLARLLGALSRRLGQPPVIGEIIGGILLGPTLFHGAVTTTLFPAGVRPTLGVLANIGVAVFMFLVGLEVDRNLLRGQGRIAATVSLSALILPFALGTLLALYLVGHHPTAHRLAFVLFVGTAMAVTAFPVLARILTDKGLIRTPIGGLALATAAVGDVVAWLLLAFVVALTDLGHDPWRVLLVVPYLAVMLWVVRPLLARLAARHPATGRLAGVGVLLAVSVGLLLSAKATDWIGLHAIFGAFLLGVVVPRDGAVALREQVVPWIRRISSVLLLPVFFMVAGLNVDLSSVDLTGLGELALILLVAVGGKFAGGFLGARVNGVRVRHSVVLAVLINARGLTELIVLAVGLQVGVLDARLASLMIVTAVVTTAMTGVLLRVVYPEERVRLDLASLEEATPADRAARTSPTFRTPRPLHEESAS
ncbi:MAG TPA: cation:proton antiporter [Micromonosporaceae bacterium]